MGSRYVAARRGGPEYVGWDQMTYMAADQIDVSTSLLHAFLQANSAKKKKQDPPEPYPRPGVKRVIKKASGLLARLRGGKEETGSLPVEETDKKIVPLRR
jgi:hypothetical protein